MQMYQNSALIRMLLTKIGDYMKISIMLLALLFASSAAAATSRHPKPTPSATPVPVSSLQTIVPLDAEKPAPLAGTAVILDGSVQGDLTKETSFWDLLWGAE